jgi:hypothetical protein
MKKTVKPANKISSTKRLEGLLTETEQELEALEPQIEKLEKQLEKLKELKLAKQKLITFKLSIKSILNNFSSDDKGLTSPHVIAEEFRKMLSKKELNREPGKNFSTSPVSAERNIREKASENADAFLPERAFQEVDAVLRRKTSINYELFRAIVFNGGRADTEAIKQYLVENNIKQPGNGERFDAVELTDISSRVNYLVRKDVVEPDGRGHFISKLGWMRAE